MKIRLLPEAERDLEIAADFYESQQSGLGSYFNYRRHPRFAANHRVHASRAVLKLRIFHACRVTRVVLIVSAQRGLGFSFPTCIWSIERFDACLAQRGVVMTSHGLSSAWLLIPQPLLLGVPRRRGARKKGHAQSLGGDNNTGN